MQDIRGHEIRRQPYWVRTIGYIAQIWTIYFKPLTEQVCLLWSPSLTGYAKIKNAYIGGSWRGEYKSQHGEVPNCEKL